MARDKHVETHSNFDNAVARADAMARHDGDRRKVTVDPKAWAKYQVTKTDKKGKH